MKYTIYAAGVWLGLLCLIVPSAARGQDALWQPTEGPLGSNIKLLAVDTSRATILASNTSVLLIQRAGEEWTEVPLTAATITALAVLPSGVYLAAVTHQDDTSSILRSVDGGHTWQPSSLTGHPASIHPLAASPRSTVFAASEEHLFRSDDAGQTWQDVAPVPRRFSPLAFGPEGTLYAIQDQSIDLYASEDEGTTWTFTPGFTDTAVLSLTIDDAGVFYAGLVNHGEKFSIQRSMGEWHDWEHVLSDFPAFPIRTLQATADGALLAGIDGAGIYRSTNQGESWKSLSVPGTTVRALFTGADGLLVAGTSEGVYESRDHGATWTFPDRNLRHATVTALLVHSDGRVLAGTDGSGLFHSDDGDHWTRMAFPALSVLALLEADGILLAGTTQGAYRSTDGGQTWQQATFETIANPVFPGPATFVREPIQTLTRHPDGTLLATVTTPSVLPHEGVYRSEDGGATWTQTDLTTDDHLPFGASGIAVTHEGTVFGATRYGLFRLNPDHTIWTRVGEEADLRAHAFISHPGAGLLLAQDRGLFHLHETDGLRTGVAFEDTTVYALTTNTWGHLFVATAEGVFRSNDVGHTWTAINTGLEGTTVQALAPDAEDGLFAGTMSHSVYRTTPAFIVTSHENPADVPARASLVQNFPNPFRTQTTIRYDLAQAGPVRLVVYDVLGREVATLADAVQPAGVHTAIFDAEALPSGVYVYRLETTGRHLSRSMLLAK